ncbi:fumarylacetoacetate hydrolase family protein [Chelatococcus asaccharovorans]|uniref:fumarylacetoacetate hydrolase family protein n=1 Tax=Chelatococcus asaccharovorans TaxID=28210 RepID=UPI00224C7767|nr:fumarylacetoacetate hydrolase family protein [Chelatococcus asaccharovorans]CAH1649836.1 2-keto-4-pentenoate hydratase/2-oxohepta-3-ene-1,7-dioic acid hydratase in catechol pathway [Chelatococcus asaccharovorans]CAH1691851.1 2-keto-4-pentenoate hydratase/2-oxohepta-3-ene-1,7-dioic acid hydratase in catechol pathway [Chelatococcus asaccharovorans]
MKIATFLHNDGTPRLGAVDTSRSTITDLALAAEIRAPEAMGYMRDALALIDGGEEALRMARALEAAAPEEALVPLASARLLAPLPVPRSIRDCLVFEQHLINYNAQRAKETGQEPATISPDWYKRPFYYKGNRFSVVGTEADIVWPDYSNNIDFELEIACIIGRKGSDIRPEDALAHIFGFTIFNDFSARDTQAVEKRMGMGSSKAKDFDTGNAIGPWIVTTDEIGDPHRLRMEARINGERWGGGNTSEMYHSFRDMISFISRSETLHPGELIGSGTVGTGCGIELGRSLSPGDTVELEIEKIGILRNRITRRHSGSGSAAPGTPEPHRNR